MLTSSSAPLLLLCIGFYVWRRNWTGLHPCLDINFIIKTVWKGSIVFVKELLSGMSREMCQRWLNISKKRQEESGDKKRKRNSRYVFGRVWKEKEDNQAHTQGNSDMLAQTHTFLDKCFYGYVGSKHVDISVRG